MLNLNTCTSDCGLSAEEIEGHGREEGRDALLVMQMKGHHFSQSLGELRFHELHAPVGALHQKTTHDIKQLHPFPAKNFQSEAGSLQVAHVDRGNC